MLNITEEDVLNAFYNYELTEDDLLEAYELGFISDNTMNLLISEKRDDFFDVVDNFSSHVASKIHGSKPESNRKEIIRKVVSNKVEPINNKQETAWQRYVRERSERIKKGRLR